VREHVCECVSCVIASPSLCVCLLSLSLCITHAHTHTKYNGLRAGKQAKANTGRPGWVGGGGIDSSDL